jgi:hypothetical protein
MAQIKVLNLCDSHSLSKLSYKDATNVTGGAFGLGFGIGYSIGAGYSFAEGVGFTASTAGIGSLFGPYGASLSTLAKS